ncbi:MAG: NfeD family protein [bacterium]
MFNILTTIPPEGLIIVWLAVVLLGIIIEATTTELISIYFSFGALISMICAIIGITFWPQLWIFVIVTAITLFATRPLFLKYIKTNEVKTNTESLIGKRFKLLKAVENDTLGEVNVAGVFWNVATNDNSTIEVNSTVEVLALEGSKLIVKKI